MLRLQKIVAGGKGNIATINSNFDAIETYLENGVADSMFLPGHSVVDAVTAWRPVTGLGKISLRAMFDNPGIDASGAVYVGDLQAFDSRTEMEAYTAGAAFASNNDSGSGFIPFGFFPTLSPDEQIKLVGDLFFYPTVASDIETVTVKFYVIRSRIEGVAPADFTDAFYYPTFDDWCMFSTEVVVPVNTHYSLDEIVLQYGEATELLEGDMLQIAYNISETALGDAIFFTGQHSLVRGYE